MTVTLNEVLKVSESRMGKAILMNLLRQTPVLRMIPIETTDALKITETRWQALPSAGKRKLGGAYTESSGTLEQFESTLSIYGGDFDVDRLLTKVNARENPLKTQAKMKTAALAALFNDDFINGDHAVDPDGFEGLKKLVANGPSRMTINLETSGDTLKVLNSAATQNTFIDALHQALHYLGVLYGDDGVRDANVAFFMNETTKLGIGQVLRRSGLVNTASDVYDRKWEMFGPAKLVDVGLERDQSTEIISSTQVAGDGGADSTEIFGVRFGGVPQRTAAGDTEVIADSGVVLYQLQGTSFEPYDPLNGGEGGAGSAPTYVRRIDTAIGLHQRDKYSVVRIHGFKMAAS